jgi:spore coat polysaccharide biosynthesis protein SpsF (cytidylyltransferase family)
MVQPMASWGQQQPPRPPDYPPNRPPTLEEEARTKMERDMAKKANQQRQAELKRDTDKLFRLATELKQYVDKTNENVLSLEVLKKAEEIEKLAHNVKDRMKGSY